MSDLRQRIEDAIARKQFSQAADEVLAEIEKTHGLISLFDIYRIRTAINSAIEQLTVIAEFTDLPERQVTTAAVREVADYLRATIEKTDQ